MMALESIRGFFPENLRGRQFDRHLLKEYVECLALEWLSKSEWASHLTFIGGTNLRLLKGIDRFSEDLDFDCKELTREDFVSMTDGLIAYLRRNGLPVAAKEQESDKLTAYRRSVLFPGLLKDLGLSPFAEERFLMKVEAQDQEFVYERQMGTVARCGFFFPVAVPPDPVLCSMKLSALLTRAKGRDFYDAMFLLMRTPPDYDYLSQRAGITDAAGLRAALLKKLDEVNLMNKKRDLEHLLFLRESAEKILSFGTFIETTLRQTA